MKVINFYDFSGSEHRFQSLVDAEKDIKVMFAELLEKYTKNITNMAKCEKDTWLRLDKERENCEAMKKSVRLKIKQKVSFFPSSANILEVV